MIAPLYDQIPVSVFSFRDFLSDLLAKGFDSKVATVIAINKYHAKTAIANANDRIFSMSCAAYGRRDKLMQYFPSIKLEIVSSVDDLEYEISGI